MRLLLILLLITASLLTNGQTSISGKVTDPKGRAIPGASITLKDTYDGATTDSSGRFKFQTSETGAHILVISVMGYRDLEEALTLNGKTIQLDLVMKEEITELKAVVISAGSFEASDKKRTTVLDPIDIVTTASALADVTGAIRTLPGAQQVGESEGLFVRGGTSSETRTYIDGTLVNNFFYSSVPNIAQRGRFSPFIFKGTVFSAGGYSALYGQALSSALILESIDLPEVSSGNLGITVVGLSAGIQRLAKNKKSSWGINYGYTDLRLAFSVMKQKQDFFQVPVYHTGDANFRIKTSNTGMLKYYGYFSANNLGFHTESIDSLGYLDRFSLRNFNMYHNLHYRETIGNKLRFYGGVSFTDNRDNINAGMSDEDKGDVLLDGLEFKDFDVDADGLYFNAKAVLERRLRGLSAIRAGGEWNHSTDKSTFTDHEMQQYQQKIKDDITAGFAEADLYITNGLAARIGFRAEHSSLISKASFSPRMSIAYKLGNAGQASLAYGEFYQNPGTRYLPAAQNLDFTRATHYIAQFQKVSSQLTFRMEAFYKKYHGLLKTEFSNGREIATGNNGTGYAKGFEIFWRDRKHIRNFDYWISYSYLDTKRDFLNFPHSIQPSFAAKHNASLVMKKFVLPWKTGFNLSYTYSTGRPYYDIRYDADNEEFYFADRGMTPDYHNVSFSLNYLPKLMGDNAASRYTVLVLSVSNIFGINQVFGYQYAYDGSRRQAIIPPSKTFVFIGAFISFGVDRTDDVINSNL